MPASRPTRSMSGRSTASPSMTATRPTRRLSTSSTRRWPTWRSPSKLTALSRLAPIFGRWSRRNLDPYADRLDLADGEVEIASGVHVLAAPGHTPGHIAVALRSEGSELLYVSDAALHPIHLEHPEWRSV